MTWWKMLDGSYVNSGATSTLAAHEVSVGLWRVQADGVSLAGSYVSEVDAEDAARKLCQGFDPSTIT